MNETKKIINKRHVDKNYMKELPEGNRKSRKLCNERTVGMYKYM